jgi:hypothetical protein
VTDCHQAHDLLLVGLRKATTHVVSMQDVGLVNTGFIEAWKLVFGLARSCKSSVTKNERPQPAFKSRSGSHVD